MIENGGLMAAEERIFQKLAGLVGLLVLASTVEAGDPVKGERLFRITRNKNDNIVCYDVIQRGGKLDKDNPVSVYWVIPSEEGRLESLNFMERRRAYGVSVEKAFGQDSVDIMLSAGENLIQVRKRGGRWVALATLDAREIAIDSIHVMADESGAMPDVQWVEVMGRSMATGEKVKSKIMK
jgi:hypothetical protein